MSFEYFRSFSDEFQSYGRSTNVPVDVIVTVLEIDTVRKI